MFDLDAYLERIGLQDSPSLADVHRAHVASIPFENLDPHRGIPPSLGPEALAEKLIERRRGGYCFEQNLLLGAALEQFGAQVEPMLARVRLGAPAGSVRPRSHLVLRVSLDGDEWHADVGFGAGTLTEPIPFGPGEMHEQSGWRFRVIPEGDEFVLQAEDAGVWRDLYGFVPQPVPLVDIETSNWFTGTHPRSPFVTGLVASIQGQDGTRTLLSDWSGLALVTHSPGSDPVTTPVEREEIPELLDQQFGLSGFALSDEGRVIEAGG